MHESESLSWFGYLITFVVAGGALGYLRYLLERRKAPADRALVVWQRREIQARIRREEESATVAGLKDLAQGLKDDRDYWKARAEKAERHLLEQEIDVPLPPKPGDGKGD